MPDRRNGAVDVQEPGARMEPIYAPLAVRGAARWLGLLLFVVASWLYAVSGLIAPIWGVGLLWAIWLGFLSILIKVWRSSPWKVLAVPIVAYVTWATVMLVGEFVLNWTA